MSGIAVHTSHRLEDLCAALAARLHAEPLPPLATETIVVPTRGLARWLELQLAERHGIAAGLRFPFPGAFLAQLVATTADGAVDLFARPALHLRLFRLLGDAAIAPQLGPAAGYCQDDPDGRKRFQLAEKLAAAFDDYQLYRGDLLARAGRGDDLADAGPHGPWQAALWRALLADAGLQVPAAGRRGRRERAAPATPLLFPELAAGGPLPGPTAAHRLDSLRALLDDGARAAAALPPRVSVFGAGALPPAFLEALQRMAARVPVHLYVPQPTPHWFGDQRPKDHAGGNALLARFGTLAREFADQLADLEDSETAPCERFELAAPPDPDAAAPSLLACVQRDVAAVFDRAAEPAQRFALDDADDSLRVHDCHSPQRELEVVRDQILAAFAADRHLPPHEVMVLVPDIATYAPYAEAVFGPVREHLPFQVADRDPASELPLCASLLAVLELAQERLAVFDVLHLCEQPALLRRFDLSPADLPALRHWCERAGIRWGLDGAARARQFQLPPFEENSWTQGLHRMLLGAATGPVPELVLGMLPAADVTSGRDELLQRFLGFLRTLFAHLPALQRSHAAEQWADQLDALVAALYLPVDDEDEQALQRLQRATADLRAQATAAALREPLAPIVLRDWLRQQLQGSASGRGFLTGAVTVAAMQPMRTVPVRLLFVCGLSDQAFPRRDQPAPFDLMACRRRPGDRSARLDDRQLFLDALLAAREALHLTYVGRSQKDESPCAPSVVVAELLDHLDRTCTTTTGAPRDRVLVRHPLQPWSRRYRTGGDPRLFTYARGDAPGTPGEPLPAPPFVTGPVEPPADLLAPELPFQRLSDFWHHPCRFHLREVLRLRFPRRADAEQETEPFAIGPLDRWQLQDPAVRTARRGDPPPVDALAAARAAGRLPVGGLGALAFAPVQAETAAFLRRIEDFRSDQRRVLRVAVGDLVVSGELEGFGAEYAVRARIARLKPRDRLRAWVQHVWMCAARAQGAPDLPQRTLVFARDRTATLLPIDGARAEDLLATLVRGYRSGLTTPLPLFDKTSWKFAEQVARGVPDDEARRRARGEWDANVSDRGGPNDSEDEAIELCLRGREPLLLPEFAEWARAVWLPYHEFSREDKP
ncbi:MAG: exodeoxyribonuclease V subunit gamma [Planctomycetes bacterium]|nr:exodeoxyribonuclease V subunit gamma [Planctomycetota bacterium]